jgi:septal ring factor EnvC (AmiA/AmiB activator)
MKYLTVLFLTLICSLAFAIESAPQVQSEASPEQLKALLAAIRQQRDATTQLAQDLQAQVQILSAELASAQKQLAEAQAKLSEAKEKPAASPSPAPENKK